MGVNTGDSVGVWLKQHLTAARLEDSAEQCVEPKTKQPRLLHPELLRVCVDRTGLKGSKAVRQANATTQPR